MWYDGKKHRGRGRPLTREGGHGLIIHVRDEPDEYQGQWKGLAPPGGEGRQSREWCQGARDQLVEAAWGSSPPQGDSPRAGE